MRISRRNPVLIGLAAGILAVIATALSGGTATAAYGFMFLAGAAGLLYAIWPELRNRR